MKKIICDACQKEKEPYFEGFNLCEKCAEKFDRYQKKSVDGKISRAEDEF